MNTNAKDAKDTKQPRLLTPKTLAKIQRLEIVAKGVVEGLLAGRHRSPYKGFSIEFAEHRQYVPGDDIRTLDWRVFARSDKYYIRQYIEETDLRATILLDASGSMAYSGELATQVDGTRPTKFEYARYLAASLSHLLISQQDAAGLVTFDSAIRCHLPARSPSNHLQVLLRQLAETETGGDSNLAAVLHNIAARAKRRSLIILISDLFDNPADILSALHHMHYRGHEVIVMHVMAQEELTFPFDRWSEFADLEPPGNKFRLDPRSVRVEYMRHIEQFLDEVRTGCGKLNVDYVQMSTDQPFENALSLYLATRTGASR